MNADVVGAIDVDLAVIANDLTIFSATVTNSDAVVLDIPSTTIAIDYDIAGIQHVACRVADQDPRSVAYADAQRDETIIDNLAGAFGHDPGAWAGTAWQGGIQGQVIGVAAKINRGILRVGKGRVVGDFYAKGGAFTKGFAVFAPVDDIDNAVIHALCSVGQLHANGQRQRGIRIIFTPGIGGRGGTEVIGGDGLVDGAVVGNGAGALPLHTKCAIAADLLIAVFINKQPGVDGAVVGSSGVFRQHADGQTLPAGGTQCVQFAEVSDNPTVNGFHYAINAAVNGDHRTLV